MPMENKIAKTLREYIKRTGTTQKDLAQRLGMQPAQFSRLINREPSDLVSISLINKIVEVTDLTETELLFEKE